MLCTAEGSNLPPLPEGLVAAHLPSSARIGQLGTMADDSLSDNSNAST
ncbi:uncharacterized protein UBRO_20604 [Ustilago bromivora]|uniref:Uncharacterized protein n=1 Tax=Ustilago bromivora TaxID=307758 RepID=A0A1K0H5D7_9BASI|nr:uncharacterized protein UBRO_20604 [Ustilago bromivora]